MFKSRFPCVTIYSCIEFNQAFNLLVTDRMRCFLHINLQDDYAIHQNLLLLVFVERTNQGCNNNR